MARGHFLRRFHFFAESYPKQTGSRFGKHCRQGVASSYSPNHSNMSNFLRIASRIEAAVASYVSVQKFADTQQWKQKFQDEFVSVHLHGF